MTGSPRKRIGRMLTALLLGLGLWLGMAGNALAAPVNWQEVPESAAGRQWWDAGSLRWNREGHLSVLSRFQPAGPTEQEPGQRPRAAELYVMELDCDLELWRDTAVNGLPRFGADWQSGDEDLIGAVIDAACAAAPPRA